MPIRRKMSTRKPRRRTYRPRRPFGISRSVRYNKVPSFVETFKAANDLSVNNAGGVLTVQFSQIPQVASYVELYKQYRINWVKAILIPDYNSYQSQAGGPNAPRMAFAISDTVATPAPASEADILTDNGARIRMLTRPTTITFRPVPFLQQQTAGGAPVAVNKKMQWINTSEAAVVHGGVPFWITSAGAPDGVVRLYYKVSFSLKDGN